MAPFIIVPYVKPLLGKPNFNSVLSFWYLQATQGKAEQACRCEILFTVIHDISHNTKSWKLLIFRAWGMEQKNLIFDHIFDIRDELAWPDLSRPGPIWRGPTRPNPAITLFDGSFLKHMKWKELENTALHELPLVNCRCRIRTKCLGRFLNYSGFW